MRGLPLAAAASWFLAAAVLPIHAPAAAEPWLVVATHGGSGITDVLYWVDLAYGGTFAADPRRGGEVLRLRRLEQNLFTTIGRRQDAPAAAGQFLLGPVRNSGGETEALLLAETDTGYMALLTRLGRGGQLGELRTLSGRPGEPLVSADGNFLLLMRRDARGRTDGAYLLHGTTGGCLLIEGLERLQDEPRSRACPAVEPFQTAGEPVTLEAADGTTTGYLVTTGERGRLLRLGLAADGSGALMATATGLYLGDLFGEPEGEAAAARRFALASIRTEGGGTRSVLAADSATGRLALLRGLTDATPAARLLAVDLARALPRDGRAVFLVPRLSAFGDTLGVWAIDAAASRAALVVDPEGARETRLEPVEIQR